MPYQVWSQDSFSKGELSPYMYARAQVAQYYDGLKQAVNVLTYPTGGAGKRFGTLYQSTTTGGTVFNQFYFETFQYLDQCVYQLVFTPLNIAIYLEGILVQNVTTTFDAQTVYNLKTTTLGALFRVTGQGFAPFDLQRFPSTGVVITAAGSNILTLTSSAIGVGAVLPVQFTTTGALPTSNPQIKSGITYFINPITLTTTQVYATAYEAKFNIDPFTITDNGSGTNTLIPENTWTFTNTVFKNLPIYDFNANYDTILFTPSQVAGYNTTITASAPIFTPALVGGAFIGNGGTSRITTYTDNQNIIVATQIPFDNTDAIIGSLALLAEPAWSDLRGWPQVCGSYQNRALFANTESLPNGFWASVINDYADFGDLTSDDDDAIAWFPTSNAVNVIRFIVPFRSITVHTNSGIYSSPLSEIAAITPGTFTLQLQDSTPADVLQPQAIDNQILILSGNDLHTMLWDGINNAYTSNIVSIINEQTIRTPVDETPFADLHRAGSRYIFVVNANGSMAVYQTLLAESVSGMTPQIMEQSYGDAYFRQCASSSNGRAWFLVERQQAQPASPIAITGFTTNTLQATGSNIGTLPIAITLTTMGTLPATVPPLSTTQYYWAIGTDANNFSVYNSQSDALANLNPLTFTSSGTSSDVVRWPLITIFNIEELTQKTYLDCALYFNNNGTPISTIQTGGLFNAQDVKMVGDGFGFETTGFNDTTTFESHGQDVPVDVGYVGFPINTVMEPMPLAPPVGSATSLTKPKHIRSIRFMFNNTIGGTINGVPIALEPFNMAHIGEPPFPARGIFELMLMKGWDDFNYPSFVIEHNDPFNIELIGVFYSVDT
jgi:hypothetical protein